MKTLREIYRIDDCGLSKRGEFFFCLLCLFMAIVPLFTIPIIVNIVFIIVYSIIYFLNSLLNRRMKNDNSTS
jgi:Flp pilus assembly protein TadB